MKRVYLLAFATILSTSLLLPTFLLSNHSRALSGNDFRPGRIIDDAIFFNKDSMNVQQIQDFLNAKVPVCDTNHVGFVGSSGTTYNPPFTCLKQYSENPTTHENNIGRPTYQVPGGQSAAQIIWNAAQQYGINPQVILTTLQKETGIVTDDWAASWQYKTAMGYGCPDTAACDANYYGFYNQVTSAAWQWRRYTTLPDQYNFKSGVTRYIQYNPSVSCGGTNIYLENQATANLYNYTPYQPNSAALSVMSDSAPGGDVSCGAYGNRNFFWYFNKWFGPTLNANLPGCTEATNTTRACVWSMYNPTNRQQFLTSSIQSRDLLYLSQGYVYVGKEFFGNVIMLPGNIPIYRASAVGGGSFLTADINEYNALVASGYTADGIDFYADPGWSNTGLPVYRLYNHSTSQHYWTSNQQQKQTLLQNGYVDEGIAFTSISPVRQEISPPKGKLLVYRFYIPQTYSHFWTVDVNERDSMIKSGYSYEGVAWNGSSNILDTPVYRLYAPSLNQHLYTTDLSEKSNLVASGGWIYEGISQYVSKFANSQPVYRLYAPSIGVHLVTADSNERNQLLSKKEWKDEGIAWYQAQ